MGNSKPTAQGIYFLHQNNNGPVAIRTKDSLVQFGKKRGWKTADSAYLAESNKRQFT